ncbi:MAG: T9SS type A sorting domain-containing protein, partial [Bacteroidetes bacterium]|nr:T9SS type A sorting domain-containing protein [Bacteroidota bacterium]
NITINANVTPSVSLADSSNSICNGTNVTFTATPTNGGSAPTYEFFLNGSSVQNSATATYSNSTLTTGDSVYVVMTANNTCQNSATATSLAQYISVVSPAAPSVSITTNSLVVCNGLTINFTASPTNGGTTPSYTWKKNSTTVGSNSNTLGINTLANGDTIRCIMTSSLGCVTSASATSNDQVMTVNNCGPVNISINSGYWRQNGTWNNNSVPTATTNVGIDGGKNVIIDGNATCKNLTIGVNDTLTIMNGGNLVVNGDFVIDGNLSFNGILNMVGGIITFTKPKTCIPGVGATYHMMYLKTSTPDTMFLCDDIKVNHTLQIFNGTVMNDNGNTAEVKGILINNGSAMGNGKIRLHASAGAAVSGSGPYYNMDIDTGGATITTNTTINGTLNLIANNFTVQNGSTLTVGNTATSTGNILSNGGLIVGGSSSTVALLKILGNASATKITDLALSNIGNIYIDRPAGVSMGMALSIRRQIDLINGNLDQNGYNLTLGGLSTSIAAANTPGGMFTNSSNTGTFYIFGNSSASTISNIAFDSINNLSVSFPAGISLGNSFYAKGSITLTSGKVDLNDQVVTISSTSTVNETASSVFFGTGGKITTTRNFSSALSNNNVAGLGGKFSTSSAPGTTIIERGPNAFTSGTGNSIKRYFAFIPSNSQTISLELNYDSTELNGANRAFLRMNQSNNNGVTWTTLTGGSRTTASNATGYIYRTNIAVTSAGSWFTASDSATSPLSPIFVLPPASSTNISATTTANKVVDENRYITVYPNPFKESFTVDMNMAAGTYTLQLTDLAGRTVQSQTITLNDGNTQIIIPTENIAYGVYNLSLMSNNKIQSIRIIKQ